MTNSAKKNIYTMILMALCFYLESLYWKRTFVPLPVNEWNQLMDELDELGIGDDVARQQGVLIFADVEVFRARSDINFISVESWARDVFGDEQFETMVECAMEEFRQAISNSS